MDILGGSYYLLSAKPQSVLIALGWVFKGNGRVATDMSVQTVAIISFIIFLIFLFLSTKGLTTLKVIGSVAGSGMLIMSILFIILAVAVPTIDPSFKMATPDMGDVKHIFPIST